jgi:hypothetical protein
LIHLLWTVFVQICVCERDGEEVREGQNDIALRIYVISLFFVLSFERNENFRELSTRSQFCHTCCIGQCIYTSFQFIH